MSTDRKLRFELGDRVFVRRILVRRKDWVATAGRWHYYWYPRHLHIPLIGIVTELRYRSNGYHGKGGYTETSRTPVYTVHFALNASPVLASPDDLARTLQ